MADSCFSWKGMILENITKTPIKHIAIKQTRIVHNKYKP